MDSQSEPAPPTPRPPAGVTPEVVPPRRPGSSTPAITDTSDVTSEPPPLPATPDTAAQGKWGRIANDGQVFVRTAEGERLIGSWQAGSPEEGLAYYELQYADLRSRVELLSQRVELGRLAPEEGRTKAAELRESVTEAHVIGDLHGLEVMLDEVDAKADVAEHKRQEEREAARTQAIERKTELVVEAEGLAQSTAWRASGERLRQILDEMKDIRSLDRRTDQSLWKRYQSARAEFSRRRGTHFSALDDSRRQAMKRKQELVEQAEELSDSTDWRPTAETLKGLMAEWKTLPRAGKEAEEELWKRFRSAQDSFFRRRSEAYSEQEAEYRANLAEKERLLGEIEAISLPEGTKEAQAKLRDLKNRWYDIGRVPRESMKSLDARFKALDDAVRGAADQAWRDRRASENPLAAQFREQISRLEAQAKRARAAGKTDEAERAEQAATSWRASLEEAEQRSS